MATTTQPALEPRIFARPTEPAAAAVEALRGITIDWPRGSGRPSWVRQAPASRRCCTSWRASTVRTDGKVLIGEIDLTTLNDKQLTLLRRDRIGFVFQAYNLIPTLTAAENITLPLDIAGRDVDQAWFDEVVDSRAVRDRLAHRPAELSGGQQQRVAGARALVSRPQIIFADEPTGNLDSKSGEELLRFLRSAVDDHGQTIVIVTHDAHAAAYADRIVFLGDGKIVAEMREPTADRILDQIKALEV